MHGAGALYFDPIAVDVVYKKIRGFGTLPPRQANPALNLIALGTRPNITGHNFNWNRDYTSIELMDFFRSNVRLFDPQQWLHELFRVMLCTESTGQYNVRTTINGLHYRIAKTRNGIMPSTQVSKGLRAPLWQAVSSFSGYEHLHMSYDITGSPISNYLSDQLFRLNSDYSDFVNLYVYSKDKMARWFWRVISVCIQAFTTGWLTVNSISQDFRQNFGTVPTVSKLITQFESNISPRERVSPVNYRGMLHNLSKVIDVPVPLAAAEKQRYFLASGQSNLQLTENQLRAVINQYTTIDLIWLQVFNRKFAPPNFINNCDLEAIKLVTGEACRITVISPQHSGVATVPLISYVYFPEFDEPDFHLKKYLKEGQYAFNNIKWSAMSAIFLKYDWPAEMKVRLVYVDVPFTAFREERDRSLEYIMELNTRKIPAANINDVNTLAVRVDLDWLRNHRYHRVNGTVRIVGVCFQGSNRVISSFEYFGHVWTGTTKEILIKEAIPQLKLYQPDNKVHLEGLLLPINGSRLATYLNQPPPELDNSSIPDILGTSSKMAKISSGKDGGSSLIEDKATESPPTAKDGDDFMDKKAC